MVPTWNRGQDQPEETSQKATTLTLEREWGLAADSGWGAAETLVGFTMQMERSLCYSKVLGCPSFAHS